MISRQVTPEIEIELSLLRYADGIYVVTDANRDFLRQWLPWLDHTKSADDTRDFIREQLRRFAQGEAIHITIFYMDFYLRIANESEPPRQPNKALQLTRTASFRRYSLSS